MTDASEASVKWGSTEAGANKPQNTRPLALFPAKESRELLAEFISIVEEEIVEIKATGVKFEVNGSEFEAVCEKCNMSMVDGKMVTSLLNCGGSYCTMCVKSQEECQKIEVIEAGFIIDRDLDTRISFVCSYVRSSRSYYPPWIRKRGGLESSGRIPSS